jgi:site-specific DNA recombinase
MDRTQAASYARVSSEQQAEANTVASQIAALQVRVAEDGLALPQERLFVDEGYSGATLIRPALERLRDLIAAGGVDRLYVHSPDRLARKYAYQVLLIDEFQRAGVEVVFLNRELGRTPEDDLLLQVQGMVAEYERAKILERSRRGKRHAAHSGDVSVLSTAPYGYLYLRKQDGGGEGRFEIMLEEARVVRQVFAWIGRDRLSIGEAVRRLNLAGERTRTGKTVWDRTTVWGILKNPAYMGLAAFGKTRVGPLQPRLRAQRGGSLQPRRAYSTNDVPREEWISVPVPALVSEELFAAVQVQLDENRRRARQGQRGARYLLQGLVLCQHCGYAFYGKPVSSSAAKGKVREYAYYRCIGTDAYRFGGERVCQNGQVRTDLLDVTVWQEVCALLEDPQRVEQEYRRRLAPADTTERRGVESQVSKLRQGLARLIDSYAEGLIEKAEFEPRIGRLRERIAALEEQAQQLVQAEALQDDLRVIIGRLDEFAASVKGGLEEADWSTRRELIRALVKRVEIGKDDVNVVFRVSPDPFVESPDRGVLQHCGRRDFAGLSEPGP